MYNSKNIKNTEIVSDTNKNTVSRYSKKQKHKNGDNKKKKLVNILINNKLLYN